MPRWVRGLAGRTAWLLLGAAIGLAAILLAVSLAGMLALSVALPSTVAVGLCLAPILLLGLVPGARELEVEAARSMLHVSAEVVVPGRMRAEHRWRTLGWVALHLLGGLLAGVLLLGALPGAVVIVAAGLTGSDLTVAAYALPSERTPDQNALVVILGVAMAVAALAGTYLLGMLARRLAPMFLGPTPSDRLMVAEARLATEAEHVRLARDLHDGIGHALSIISLQAAAARRQHRSDGGDAGEGNGTDALAVIELTARQAADELDAMLRLLRDEAASRHPEPDLDQLDQLLAVYRDSGMPVAMTAADLGHLPALTSRTAYRIVAEGLNNAQRHGARGPVELRVDRAPDSLDIDLWNSLGRVRGTRALRAARGLVGIRERAELFGGSATAGPDEHGRWHLRVRLPTGSGR